MEELIIKKHILNNKIRAKEVRLIDKDGCQVGIVPIEHALAQALENELDLLQVSETTPPVCKVLDFGQFRYQQQKKEKQAKKNTKSKELKMRPKISLHDYEVRLKRGIEFLQKGYKLKITIFFRGREIIHRELGIKLLNKYIEEIQEYGLANGGISDIGRSMIITFSPK
ncbi:MAG: translation initiation factor IF-3 [bacterium]|nr:translation initiation factor IF-3 [bacterium]